MNKCPKCGREHCAAYSTISRVDKTMLICPICGLHEILDEIGVTKEVQAIILNETERTGSYERL